MQANNSEKQERRSAKFPELLKQVLPYIRPFFDHKTAAAITVGSQSFIHNDKAEFLLRHVVCGNLVQVKHMLDKWPELAGRAISIKDLSERLFPSISALQYAAWALDIPMQELIKKYMPEDTVKMQMEALNDPNGEVVKAGYGAHFSLDEALGQLADCRYKYNVHKQSEGDRQWCNVWLAQRKFPAWLILMICEEGADTAWVKLAMGELAVIEQIMSVTRDPKHLKWWFNNNYNGDPQISYNSRSNWSGWESPSVARGVEGRVSRYVHPEESPMDWVEADNECLVAIKSALLPELQNTPQLSI